MTNLVVLLVGYLLGSIPFGLVLTRLAGTEDIRTIGSGNIGATNVLRTGNKGLAAATLLLDALKGTAAVWIGAWLGDGQTVALAGFAAFLGHIFPVWLKFKGGKGVATYLGVLLGFFWPAFVVFVLVWLAVAYFTRYSSAAALVASALVPLTAFLMPAAQFPLGFIGFLLLIAAILWWRHAENIKRLLAGTEGKIGQKG